MRILIIDDEIPARKMLADAVRAVFEEAEIVEFGKVSQALEFIAANKSDIAFLDINMPAMNGIELSKRIKESSPMTNIIFVTGYSEYKGAAMDVHASGYIMKPVTVEKVREEIKYLRNPVETAETGNDYLLKARCFGSFEVFTSDGTTLHFSRSKAKELLALLIYKRGAGCSLNDICSILFEGEELNSKTKNYVQQLIVSLLKTMKESGAEEAIIKQYNSLAVNPDRIDCDYYRFNDLDARAVNSYKGEFMSQYKWAEFKTDYIEKIYMKNM